MSYKVSRKHMKLEILLTTLEWTAMGKQLLSCRKTTLALEYKLELNNK